jgi:signal peptidase I
MNLRWFISKGVREASAVHKHYYRLLAAQRDLLGPQALNPVQAALDKLSSAIQQAAKQEELLARCNELQAAAEKWLKPYPNASGRENVEVLLVALAVAMGIRTFFLQPFKIPTGSMQPTLFGVTQENLLRQPDFKMPTGWERVKQWFAGYTYIHVVANTDGQLEAVDPPVHFLIFNIKQTLVIGGQAQTIWFPPDYGEAPLEQRAGLYPGEDFRKGQDVINLCVKAGDHLFVDRFTYNFRRPDRGEIVVFATAGTEIAQQDQFYIKRLTVLPNERVQIGDDRHLIINGVRLDAATPHFEKVYGFDPKSPPQENHYSGHVNGTVAREYYPDRDLAPKFPNQDTVFSNGPDSYMMMGDNTCNSSDSRTWGTAPTKNVIGKSFFVYWPLTDRFGWE